MPERKSVDKGVSRILTKIIINGYKHSEMHRITQFHYFWQGFKSEFEIKMTQGQYFKEIDYTNYLLSESYDQGKGYIVLVLFSRVLLEYFPCPQTCVLIY